MTGRSSDTEARSQTSWTTRLFERTSVEGEESGDDDTRKSRFLLGGQILWMAVAFGILALFEMWSLELYFVVSFVGLLVNRVLFAPTDRRPRWWRILDVVTWFGFLVLALLLYAKVESINAVV